MKQNSNFNNNQIIGDKFGPEYAVKFYNPQLKIWGFLVIDNTRLGLGKGGVRMTPTVTLKEVSRLARGMTFKNALAGIAFGGAKAGICFDPKKHSPKEKEQVVKWFAEKIRPFVPCFYIPGPDINIGEKEMDLISKTIGTRKAATGKPKKMGGLPHELGSTGFGVAQSAKIALEFLGIDIKGAAVAIEGFGNVGTFTFRFLEEMGAKIIAVSDSKGGVYNPQGLDYKKLMEVKKKTGSVKNYKEAKKISNRKLFEFDVDVLITAALPDVINGKNANKIKAKLVVEGANISIEPSAEKMLHKKGVLVLPDILASAGGVISSHAEYKGYGEKKMFEMIKEKISKNTLEVLKKARKTGQTPRYEAMAIAEKRITEKPWVLNLPRPNFA